MERETFGREGPPGIDQGSPLGGMEFARLLELNESYESGKTVPHPKEKRHRIKEFVHGKRVQLIGFMTIACLAVCAAGVGIRQLAEHHPRVSIDDIERIVPVPHSGSLPSLSDLYKARI